MWEDEQNVKGGRWLTVVDKNKRQQELDHIWMEILLALIGEHFGEDGEDICGAAVNVRQKGDKVSIHTLFFLLIDYMLLLDCFMDS